ncbi:MAG: helix-turn-helix transcriptional regulator [Gammaproteobacteria bacterium]|nr:helix-turn-helix transcriptional regulator [Gammaproteobacteria bacterium]
MSADIHATKYMTTNYKLVKARESAGLTQEELARAIGVKPEQVNMWELGKSRPYPAHLKRIAEATKRSLAWFHGEDELILDLAGLLPEQMLKKLKVMAKENGQTCAEEAVSAIIDHISQRKSRG